ncbi:hypothetical protein SISNIDRAFT_545923 [Sistotremastrum niveocremeum HHB9708]|uniref:Carrier domain-containing protein n=1 Tax=Sistotremastrum niveocremeum HHB9708 TaxID=1314777 RepID=A0A165AJC9_9AGAM|nr:hypothetical protein SISNIDRAFT_545923 [Sistotremastrum niveocremeum HHB9708]
MSSPSSSHTTDATTAHISRLSDNPINQVLNDYRHVELPNLSQQRVPPSGRHVETRPLQWQEPGLPENALVVALAKCLSDWCGTQNILLGVSQTDSLKVVRLTWSSDCTWKQAIAQVREAVVDVPEKELASGLGLQSLQSAFLAILSYDGSLLDEHPLCFDLRSSSSITAHISLSLFSPSAAQLLLSQLSAALSCLSSTPDALLKTSQLPRDSPLMSCYIAPNTLPQAQLPTLWIDKHADERPDHPAVYYYPSISIPSPPHTLTYGQLMRYSNLVAHWLIHSGLQSDDKVAVCMPRKLDFHVAVVAVMKAGGCYVPIDPELPPARKSFIAEDSKARFILISGSDDEPDFTSPNFLRFPDYSSLSSFPSTPPEPPSLDSVAYLLYTSGTSGTPKGCLLTHRNLFTATCGLTAPCEDITNVDEDRYLGLASVAFDVHLAEIFIPWKLGIATTTAPRVELLQDLAEALDVVGATHMGCVPSLIDATFGRHEGKLAKVKYLTSGGEKMSDTVLESWSERDNFRLVNFYGPSETTIGCSCEIMNRQTTKDNIGRTWPGCNAYVVSASMEVLPRGAVGELVLEGPIVGRGYHNRLDLTEKVFLRWPEKDSWAYRTGDLVRMMPDDTLEIKGRADSQVKLRGVRIEVDGISNVIRKGAAEALNVTTLLAKHPTFPSPQLVTFIAPVSASSKIPVSQKKNGQPPPTQRLPSLVRNAHECASRELATYMRPSHIIAVQWIPITSNGKADLKVLEKLFASISTAQLGALAGEGEDQDNLASQDPMIVQQISQLIANATGIREADVDTRSSLFELGFDSLRLIELASALRGAFKVSLSVPQLMKRPSINGIAALVSEIRLKTNSETATNPPASVVENIARETEADVRRSRSAADIECVLPTFPIQEGVFFRSEDDPTLYVQHFIMSLEEGTDVALVKQSWETAYARLAILRIILLLTRDKLVQLVLNSQASPFPWFEQHEFSTNEDFTPWFHRQFAHGIAQDISRRIDQVPPWRLNFFAQERHLVLSIHHVLYDGISLPLLLKEVEHLYLEESVPPPPKLNEILEYIHGQDAAAAENFWKHKFSEYAWPELRPMVEGSSARFMSRPMRVGARALFSCAASFKITINALLMSAFAQVLNQQVYHTNDIVFGVIRSGRTIPVEDAGRAICPLITITPTRVTLQDGAELTTRLRSIQDAIINAQPFENISLGKVKRWIAPERDLFDILFSVAYEPHVSQTLWKISDTQPLPPDFNLSMEVLVDPAKDTVTMRVNVMESFLSTADMHLFLDQFESTVYNGASSPFSRLHSTQKRGNAPIDMHAKPKPVDLSPPDESLERSIADVVARHLDLTSSTMNGTTPFLSLGIDSLSAVRLSKELRKAEINVSAMDIMRSRTIRSLSGIVQLRREEEPVQDVSSDAYQRLRANIQRHVRPTDIALSSEDAVELYPTTALQSGMLAQTLATEGQLYVHEFSLKLRPQTDISRLQAAWRTTINNLAILRTSFHFSDALGAWIQATHSTYELDWVEGSVDNSEDYIQDDTRPRGPQFGTLEALQRPPLRFRLVRTADQNDLLVVTLHHALYDGMSIPLLFQHVFQNVTGTAPSPGLQFVDILPTMIDEEEQGVSYWRELLKGYTPLAFDRQQEHAACLMSRSLEVTPDSILELARRLTVTPQSIYQTALGILLMRIFDRRDVAFGHVVSGRLSQDVESVIGPLFNTLPFRIQIPKNQGLLSHSLIQVVHESNVSAVHCQRTPLRTIQKDLGSGNLLDVLFLYQPAEAKPAMDQPAPIWEMTSESISDITVQVQYGLNVEVYQDDSSVTLVLASAGGVIFKDDLSKLGHDYEEILRQLTQNQDIDLTSSTTGLNKPSQKQNMLAEADVLTPEESTKLTDIKSLLAEALHIPVESIHNTSVLRALGVDSISAIQICFKARRLGLNIGASDFNRSRTVGNLTRLARRIDTRARASDSESSLSDGSVDDSMVLTPGMKWFVGAWRASGGARYRHCFAFQSKSSPHFDRRKLKRAWFKLLDRHTILRTCVHLDATEGAILESIPSREQTWSEEELGESMVDTDWITNRMQKLFDEFRIAVGTIKALVVNTPSQDYFVVSLHHYQYDAWSFPLMIADLEALYIGKPCPSNNEPAGFRKLSLGNPSSKRQQRSYWQSIFPTGRKPQLFPMLNPLVQKPSRQSSFYPAVLDNTSSLMKLSRQHGVSMSSIFLAAWAKVQGTMTDESDVIFGLWHGGRSARTPGIETLAFPCVNILPMRVHAEGVASTLDLAGSIQADLIRRTPIIEQTDLVSLDQWIEGNRKPLCNVFVNIVPIGGLANFTDEESIFDEMDIQYKARETLTRNASSVNLPISSLIRDDIMVDILFDQSKDSLAINLECEANALSGEQAATLVARWGEMLRQTC